MRRIVVLLVAVALLVALMAIGGAGSAFAKCTSVSPGGEQAPVKVCGKGSKSGA